MRLFKQNDCCAAPGVAYNVSIAAVNRAGPGEFSVFIHFTQEQGMKLLLFATFIVQHLDLIEPNIPPKNVTITRPSPTVMVVSWIPLNYSEARGFISHYTVTVAYFPLTSGQALDTMTQTVPGMDTNTTRIEGLDANTDYIVQVSATNGAGTSHLSAPLHVVADTTGMASVSSGLLIIK